RGVGGRTGRAARRPARPPPPPRAPEGDHRAGRGACRGPGSRVDRMQIEVERVERLRFDHGGPVRAASAVVGYGDGFLVVQDDATHAAWFVDGRATAVRLLPAVDGLEAFDEASATKHLKP